MAGPLLVRRFARPTGCSSAPTSTSPPLATSSPTSRELGCSHLYLSPSFQARAGSTHGYDVIDPGRVSDDLGGEEGLRALAATAHEHGMGIVLDVVPNHMATDEHNRFWADPTLRAQFFDVDPVSGRHRRFFDIDELAGVRMEDPDVFAAVSGLALRLIAEGVVDGLRVDHPDGLTDPLQYLQRLRDGGAEHVWVEKILDPDEALRADWPVSGTVGYEFANDVAALFVDPAAERALTELYASLTGDARPFAELAAEAKLEQARTAFTPEVERLRRLWRGRDPIPELEEAVASLPIYRTYVEPDTARVEAADREALAEAERHGLPAAIRRVLTLDDASVPAEFVRRFQQTTPPVMAKGVEDTAFYRYVRLLALNEVGGDPGRFGIDVDTFHAANLQRLPLNLLVSSTHDTKRSGDVRARLCALTAIPDEWAGAVRSWFEVNAPLRDAKRGAPDAGRGAADLPDARRRLADRRRAAGGVRRQGAARGQGVVELDHAEPGARGGRHRALPSTCSTTGRFATASTRSPPGSPSWARASRWPRRCSS